MKLLNKEPINFFNFSDFKDEWKQYKKDTGFSQHRNIFNFIIRDYNEKLAAVAKSGVKVKIPYIGFHLAVVQKPRRSFTMIDFHRTMLLKKELIAEGKTLYTEWKNENGETVNNGGEKYFVYYTDDYFARWKFFKSKKASTYNVNISKTIFFVNKANKKNINFKELERNYKLNQI